MMFDSINIRTGSPGESHKVASEAADRRVPINSSNRRQTALLGGIDELASTIATLTEIDSIPLLSINPLEIAHAASSSYQSLIEAQLVNLPQVLKIGNLFVCWREVIRNGKPTKVPVNPHNGNDAAPNDASTWGTLADALAFYRQRSNELKGVGRMFDPADEIIGLDFDDCFDNQGRLKADHLAAKWLPRFDSYTEVSPSGLGAKTWVSASHYLDGKTGRRNANLGIEIYQKSRYFTLTGQALRQFSGEVQSRQAEVDEFYREVFGAKKRQAETAAKSSNSMKVDAEIFSRAASAKNGAKFRALFDGDITGYGSPSEADAALCSILSFWTSDKEQVRRLFGQSALAQRGKWQRLDYQDRTLNFASSTTGQSVHLTSNTALPSDAIQNMLDDTRPKVRLSGDNWLLSQTAADLGQHLADKNLFVRNGEVVFLDAGKLRPLTPQTLRTLVEQHVVCYRQRTVTNSSYEVDVTMRDDEARGIMASLQFTEKLPRLSTLNSCQLPVIRNDGKLELLPEGYDLASQTLTITSVRYAQDMALSTAVETMNDLLSEFCFADGERSKAVAVAGLIGLFGAQLLPDGALRPCFIVTKNAEGAGATTLVSCMVVPVIGCLPAGVKSEDDAEVRKMLTAAVRESQPVLLFDNQKSRLSSASLEAFLSSPTWSDRLLGTNQMLSGQNHATVFVTSNGCTVSPDMRRRSLAIELHLEAEFAEDRQFKRPLDLPTLTVLRPEILSACWSLVRHWQSQGKPQPSRSHSAFPTWAKVIGGIVQAAGFGCPLDTALVAVAVDEDGEAMRRLVAAMEPGVQYTFAKIVDLSWANGCFDGVVSGTATELTIANRVKLAKVLSRYDGRHVKYRRFIIEGTAHARRYYIEEVDSDARLHALHAVSGQAG
jgi:putative DNA primase/helicase